MVFGIETDFKSRWQALTPTARLAEFNNIRKPFWFEYKQGIDILVFSGHKFHATKGVGGLFLRNKKLF